MFERLHFSNVFCNVPQHLNAGYRKVKVMKTRENQLSSFLCSLMADLAGFSFRANIVRDNLSVFTLSIMDFKCLKMVNFQTFEHMIFPQQCLHAEEQQNNHKKSKLSSCHSPKHVTYTSRHPRLENPVTSVTRASVTLTLRRLL